jgi:hypothetical protein
VTGLTGVDPISSDEVARVRPVADPDRNGGGGLSVRTLAIASAASLTAAIVSSRLFPPGTIYASALTPVLVAAVSEMLNRPADRVSELRRQRRTMVMEAARAPEGEEAGALRGAPDFARGADAEEELTVNGNGTGDAPPIRIHGRTRSRVLHPKVWLATGAVAFVVVVGILTLPELIFGGAVANKHRTTFFGGGSTSTQTHTTTTKTESTPQETVTETVPSQTPAQQTDTNTTPTETQTTPTETGTETAPSGGTPPPTDTGTSTTPGGAAVPPTP